MSEQHPATPQRCVLEGVPRVGFGNYAWCLFSECLRACLSYLGEDVSYITLMGVSGSAFRLQWNSERWDLGNIGILHMAEDALEPFRRAFEAVGYGCEALIRSEFARGHGVPNPSDDEAAYRARIVESIARRGRPALGIGIVGPPEPCILAGYDEGGDVLIGWSFFQGPGEECEPSGYFRKRDWFAETQGLICIGEKEERPPVLETYRKAIAWAHRSATITRIRAHHSGPAAFQAWAEAMTRDEEFPADELGVLNERLMTHYDAMCMVDNRPRGAQFLREASEHLPAMAPELCEAARCYEAQAPLLEKMHACYGGFIHGEDPAQLRRLADPEARRRLAAVILEARRNDMEAAGHLARALQAG